MAALNNEKTTFVTYNSTLDIAGKNAQPEFNIYVRLRRFSIRGPHPRASTSDIFIMKSLVQKPHAMINIVGRHLILMVLLGHPLHPRHPLRGAYIYVYNWELGTLLMVRSPSPNSIFRQLCSFGNNLYLRIDLYYLLEIHSPSQLVPKLHIPQ